MNKAHDGEVLTVEEVCYICSGRHDEKDCLYRCPLYRQSVYQVSNVEEKVECEEENNEENLLSQTVKLTEVISENRYLLNRNYDGDTSDKMTRWKAQLAEFDYQVEHAEGDNLVDHQSCLPCNSCLHRNVTSTPVLSGVGKFISTDPLMDLIYSIPPSTTEMLCTTVCYYNPYSEDHSTVDICDNHKRGFEDMYS